MNGTTLNLKLGILNKSVFFSKMIITEKNENFLFSIHNPGGVKLLTRLRLQL